MYEVFEVVGSTAEIRGRILPCPLSFYMILASAEGFSLLLLIALFVTGLSTLIYFPHGRISFTSIRSFIFILLPNGTTHHTSKYV
jgi:hypothetical protein